MLPREACSACARIKLKRCSLECHKVGTKVAKNSKLSYLSSGYFHTTINKKLGSVLVLLQNE